MSMSQEVITEQCQRYLDEGAIQGLIWDPTPSIRWAIGVVLIGGERIVFTNYPRHNVVRKVATTVAFFTDTPWWLNVPLAREVIKVVGGVN